MKFKEYLNTAWSTHATEPKSVLEDIKQKLTLIESEEDIFALAQLIVHLSAEHLGDWQAGLELLRKLKNSSLLKNRTEMSRFVAILELGNNGATSISQFTPSEQSRILSTLASALANLGGLKRSESYLIRAEELTNSLPTGDPAYKTLAMTGNNMATSLEEKADRTPGETELMLKAAAIGRVFWEKAGTWREIERAEYRLAQSHLKAGLLDQALAHANTCLEIVAKNNNEPLEVFFGLEVQGLIFKEQKNESAYKSVVNKMQTAFNELTPGEQLWCKKSLLS